MLSGFCVKPAPASLMRTGGGRRVCPDPGEPRVREVLEAVQPGPEPPASSRDAQLRRAWGADGASAMGRRPRAEVNSRWTKSTDRSRLGRRSCRRLGGMAMGKKAAGATAVSDVGDYSGPSDERRTSVLREAEPDLDVTEATPNHSTPVTHPASDRRGNARGRGHRGGFGEGEDGRRRCDHAGSERRDAEPRAAGHGGLRINRRARV